MKGNGFLKKVIWLFPSLIGFFVFYLLPFLLSFYYALIESAFSGRFVGLANMAELLENPYFCRAMKNTLLFTAVSVPAVMLLSAAAAILLLWFTRRIPLVRVAFFLPVLLPSAVIAAVWNGYLPQSVQAHPFLSLLVLFLWKYSGLNIMLIFTALTGVDRDMLDAAQIDGAGGGRQIFFITLPNITPTLFFVLILSFVNSLKIYRESYLLYGNHPAECVYMLQNYLGNQFDKLNYQNIASAAVVFSVLVYTAVAVLLYSERKWSASVW